MVAAAGRVVCGDTGIAHLATALGTPSVVLFGPVPPAEWGPPPDRPVTSRCGPAGRPHANSVDPGLLAISVAEVDRALAGLPDRSPVPGPELATIGGSAMTTTARIPRRPAVAHLEALCGPPSTPSNRAPHPRAVGARSWQVA